MVPRSALTLVSALLAAAHLPAARAEVTPAVFAQFDSGRIDRPAPGNGHDVADWRRVRLSLAGRHDSIGWKAEYDTVTGNVTDLVLHWTTARGTWSVGQFKQPHGQDALQSDRIALLPESAVNGLAVGRRLGLQWSGALGATRLQASAFGRDLDDNGPDAALALRAHRRAALADGLLHLGASVVHERGADPPLRYRARPEAGPWSASFIGAGSLAADTLQRGGLELAWQRGPLLLQSEWLGHRIDGPGDDHGAQGAYLLAAWTVHGAPRQYSDGLFKEAAPVRGLGAVELVARVATLELPLPDGRHARMDTWTLGANAQIGEHLRLGLAVGDARRDSDGLHAGGWILRTQIAF